MARLRPRILLTQRAEIEAYPPVLHQAAILDGVADVSIVDTASDTGATYQTADTVHRIRVPARPSDSVIQRGLAVLAYRNALTKRLSLGVDVCIAFEPDAAAFLLQSSATAKTKKVVHLHEHLEERAYAASRVSGWAIKSMMRNIRRAALLVVPDTNRASSLTGRFAVDCPIEVVMNCPMLLHDIPASRLLPWLAERNQSSALIAHYQGSIGPHHGLEVIIRSMHMWPANAIFVLVGSGAPSYVADLKRLAAKLGVGDRLLFVGRVPYNEVLSYAVGATVGLTLLDPTQQNWHFAAGASNKRFEYAAIGVPQVTNVGPGINELFVKRRIALATDPSSPEDVGRNIAFLLENAEARRLSGEAGRAQHLATYNYEYQYRPVLERLDLEPSDLALPSIAAGITKRMSDVG